MKVETSRFGTIEVKDEEVYTFPEGLLGFAGFKQFVLLDNPTGGPMMWLQSIEKPTLAFIICPPQIFKTDYKMPLRSDELQIIELDNLEEAKVMTIMVIPDNKPKEMTANLQGPLVFNTAKKLAKQYVLLNTNYTTKYKVFQE